MRGLECTLKVVLWHKTRLKEQKNRKEEEKVSHYLYEQQIRASAITKLGSVSINVLKMWMDNYFEKKRLR